MPNRDIFGVPKGRGPFALFAQTTVSGAATTSAGWTFESIRSNYTGVVSAGNTTFNLPQPGFYKIIWQPNVNVSGAMYCYAEILVNGVVVVEGYNLAFNANPIGMTATYMAEFKPGDKITARVSISSGSATVRSATLLIEQVGVSGT